MCQWWRLNVSIMEGYCVNDGGSMVDGQCANGGGSMCQ